MTFAGPPSWTLLTDDGVSIDATYLAAPDRATDLAIVVAHGFAGSWRRPAVRRVVAAFRPVAAVVSFDFRGHGRSGGRSTLGDREVLDLEAAVGFARARGHRRVATVGFSMGGSVVVRHAATLGGLAAVVSVSAPSRWFYRGTTAMRRLHWVVERPTGRLVGRMLLRTRISSVPWSPVPVSPRDVAGRIAPTPLLVVHGDRDAYFPLDHAWELYAAARHPKELWVEPGYGHAEAAADERLIRRIGDWVQAAALSGCP